MRFDFKTLLPTLAACFVLWHIVAIFLSSPLLPGPLDVFYDVSLDMLKEISFHLLVSSKRILLGLGFGFIFGVISGFFLGRHPFFDRIFSPFLYVTYPFPKVVLIPILFLFVGVNELCKVLLIAIISFYQIIVAARDIARNIDQRYLDSFHSIGGSSLSMYRHVLLPYALPGLLTGLRISFATSLAVLFFAETYATHEGIGFYIWDSFGRFDYTGVYAGSFVLCMLGLLFYIILDLIENRLP